MRTEDREARIQQAIAQGPSPEASHAEPRQVVRALKRPCAAEVTRFLEYTQHACMTVSLLAPVLREDSDAHATPERRHAARLATRVQPLGGVPTYHPAEIAAQAAKVGGHPAQGPTLTDMVIEDLPLERRQGAAYTALLRALSDRGPTTRRLLVAILADTEQQASERADYLKRRADTRP
jgi:bacterioferritin (cytochrome b1)